MELLTRIDYYLLVFMHDFCEKWANYLTPFSNVMSFIGKDGIVLFVIALILMLFKNTRKIGVCVFGAIGCGAIFSNIIVKDMFMRPRPFETFDDIRKWWEVFGITKYSDYSFPSGHCTAASAFACGFGFAGERDRKYWTLLLPIGMCFARCYLLMHYPSDCIAGLVLGFAGALIAWIITAIIFKILEHFEDVPFFDFLLNWDLIEAIRGPEENRPAPRRTSRRTHRTREEDDEDDEEDEEGDEEDEVIPSPKPKPEHTEDGRKIFRAGD